MRHIAKSWLFHPLLERELKLARQAVKSRRLSSRDLCIGIVGDFFHSKPRRRLEKPNRTPLRGSSCKRSATKVLIARENNVLRRYCRGAVQRANHAADRT